MVCNFHLVTNEFLIIVLALLVRTYINIKSQNTYVTYYFHHKDLVKNPVTEKNKTLGSFYLTKF